MAPFKRRAGAAVASLALVFAISPLQTGSPARASVMHSPSIVKAAMLDANRDGRADEVVLTYSAEVNHKLQTKGTFPFSVEGYKITSVSRVVSSAKLTIHLAARSASDLTVTPIVSRKASAAL